MRNPLGTSISQTANCQAMPMRRIILLGMATASLAGLMAGCSPEAVSFKSTDITGAAFAQDFKLKDHNGQSRMLADFSGKIVVVFFGFTQCPDVCPTSMTTMAEVKRLLGSDGERLQVLFITVDPERDTTELLRDYMQNFDATFLALRPETEALKAVATDFKIYFKQVPGPTPTSYTMDHSAGKYIYDTQGKPRLFSAYGTEAAVIAADIKTLLRQRTN